MVNSAFAFAKTLPPRDTPRSLVGLTGLEPVTLRLSSACSNQLSYRPAFAKVTAGKPAQHSLSQRPHPRASATRRKLACHTKAPSQSKATKYGGKGTRTPDL